MRAAPWFPSCLVLSILVCIFLFGGSSPIHAQGRSVQITRIDFSEQEIELHNFGNSQQSFGTTWNWCVWPAYPMIGGTIGAGQSRVFSFSSLTPISMDPTAGSMAIYRSRNQWTAAS